MSDPIAEALWKKVCDDLSSAKAHDAFIAHCRTEGLLADAARRYRERKEALPEDAAEERAAIDKRLGAIAVLAMSQLDLHRTPPTRSRLMLVLKIMALLIAIGAAAMLVRALATLAAAG